MAVLEAMAAGLPVLITPGCNFPSASEISAAVCVEPSIDGTESGLRELFAMDSGDRRAMGERARQLVKESYTWDAIAVDMIRLYAWLCGRGPKPEFVHS